MKNCPNCHHQAKDDALFCPVCGTTLDAFVHPGADYFKTERPAMPAPVVTPQPSVVSAHDHTKDYVAEDIQYGKLVCMAVYLLDILGIIIALLMSGSSEYVQFHIRQSLKFTILEALVILFTLILGWTVIIPVLGLVALIVLIIIKLSCFIDVCHGKAKDAPLVRSLQFLN